MQHYRPRLFIAAATIATILVAAAIDDLVPGTPWHILEQTDEMTDEKSYLVSTVAREAQKPNCFGDETRMVVRIKPAEVEKSGALKYAYQISLYHSDTSFPPDSATITTRFNREKATSATWRTVGPNYNIALPPDRKAMYAKLNTSTNLLVRFQDILGQTKTYSFDISNLSNALKQVKKTYLKAKEVRP